MADLVNKTIEIVCALPLSSLDHDWVKACWDAHFLDSPPLPLASEDVLQEAGFCVEQLLTLHEVVEQWKLRNSDTEGLWTVLAENDVSHKEFVALLAYLIPTDIGAKTCRAEKREAAFAAATAYLSLVVLPGSRAFKIYSQDLLLRAVDILKSDSKLGKSGSQKRTPKSGSQRSKPQPRKRHRRGSQQELLLSQSLFEEDEDRNDESNEDQEELTPSQVNRFRTLYINLLKELVSLLESFSLRESLLTTDHIMKVLGSLVRQDNEHFDGKFPVSSSRIPCISALAYKGMSFLCQSLHGDVTALTTAACKHLLPCVLMLVEGNKVCTAQTVPQFLQLGRNHALSFVRYMLKECGSPALGSAKILLQHLCMKVPDRAEHRTKVAQAVVMVLNDFPDENYASMLKWIGTLSTNEKANLRVVSLEIIALLLEGKERNLKDTSDELKARASHAFLMNQLLARCSDVSAGVRTRAITGFAQCLETSDVCLRKAITERITPRPSGHNPSNFIPTPVNNVRTSAQADRTTDNESIVDAIVTAQETNNSQDVIEANQDTGSTPVTSSDHTPGTEKQQMTFCSVELASGLNNSLPDRQGIVSMLQCRAHEGKVHVRKAALMALHKFILFEAPLFNKLDIDLLCERCRDEALSVRKQAMISLSEVLMQFQRNPVIQSAWLNGVLPLVWDKEMSIQDKCLELLEEVILNNIVPCHRSKDLNSKMAWDLLTLISKGENTNLRRYFRKACRLWEQQKKLKNSLVASVLTHIKTENNQATWSFLADLASSKLTVDVKPVIQYWMENCHNITAECSGEVWENVLKVIRFGAKSIPDTQRTTLINDFKSHLLKFYLKPILISAFASTVHQLSRVQVDEDFHQSQKWGSDILDACDQYLSGIVLFEDCLGELVINEDLLICHLFTLGVVSQLCPSIGPKRIPMLVQSFIAKPCLTASGDKSDDSSETSSHISQGSEGTQGSQGSQPLSQFSGSKMSDRVRAVAFLTLGKLCLQDQILAKKCVPAMARELEVSTNDDIRNNVVIIMRDLCIRYTNLVDPYISNMATCLRDPAPIVRRQSVELITGLLQEDYLKWKGMLFFRFICTLLDPHPDICAFAEFCLGHHLLKRHPTLMSQHLLESIFVFNDYDKHPVFNKYTQTARERELFSLKGRENQSKRLQLYHFMLKHMEDEHRFNLTAKISQEVLGAVVDDVLPFDPDSSCLMQDALAILSSKEIKLSSLRSKPVEDVSDEIEIANAVIDTAKKTFITQVVKKNVMENVVPLVLSLKHLLEKERSPLLKDLMAFLHELMKDYKNEIKDILAADKQLACEVEYDLCLFEKQQLEEQRNGQTTPQSAPPDQVFKETENGSQVAHNARSPAPAAPSNKVTPAKSFVNRSNIATPIIVNLPVPEIRTPQELISAVSVAMAQNIQQLRNKRLSSQNHPRPSTIAWAENIASKSDLKNCSQQDPSDNEATNTPPRQPLRAISTPSGALSNVTFAGESNMTLPVVPPSPIPGQCRLQVEEESEEINIVYMQSPNVPQPKPRKWKVKVKSKEQMEEELLPAAIGSPVLRKGRKGNRSHKSD